MSSANKDISLPDLQPVPIIGQKNVLKTLTQLLYAEAGSTFIIQDEVSTYVLEDKDKGSDLENGFKLKEDITLIFQGGKLKIPSDKTSFFIEGNQTAIEAPIDQIFGEGLDIAGSWLCDRAYPQWFDWRVGKEKENSYDGDHIDCAIAINKAIQMKKAGEVFLVSGCYYIATPIRMLARTRLIGEWSTSPDNEYGGTVITPYLTDSPWPEQALVFINTIKATDDNGNIIQDENGVDKLTWEQGYPIPMGLLKGIVFRNYSRPGKKSGEPFSKIDKERHKEIKKRIEEQISRIPCCIVEGGFTFEDLLFASFRRCIKWGEHYSDCKAIRRCVFYPIHNNTDMGSDTCYAMEIRGLGDALRIEQCHVSDSAEYDNTGKTTTAFHALYLRECKGGSIINNILNGKVRIEASMGIDFSQNHLERGSGLMVASSDISICNNYFEKTDAPPITIDLGTGYNLSSRDFQMHMNSNLNITGNIFYIFSPFPDDKGNVRFPIKKVCEYDIALCDGPGTGDGPYCIHLRQNYRYLRHDNGSHDPTGIMLCKFDPAAEPTPDRYKSFDAFNRRSYFLSTECTIVPGFRIDETRTFSEVPSFSWIAVGSSSDAPNATKEDAGTGSIPVFGNGWPYKYEAQIIMDSERHIAGETVDVNLFQYDPPRPYNPEHGQVFFLHSSPERSAFMLRLFRIIPGQIYDAYVDIPVVGTMFLFDNNFSVNGYRWQPYDSTNSSIFFIPYHPEWLQFRGDNVKCFFLEGIFKLPSGWKNCDELVNGARSFYLRNGNWTELNK